MSWLDLATTILDSARVATGLAVNWLIQSTLLITTGLAVGYWLRNHGSAVQSAVYRTTLVAVLAVPLATWGLSYFGYSGWSFRMPVAYDVADVVPKPLPEPAPNDVAPQSNDLPNLSAVAERSLEASTLAIAAPSDFEITSVPSEDITGINTVAPGAVELAPPTVEADAPPAIPALAVNRFGIGAACVGVFWSAASGWLVARLLISSRQLRRLRRGARPADAVTIETCGEMAALLGVVPPEVLHSPFLPSPCLTGVRRPAIMLPDTELSMPVRDVFVHELAHLRRHDCFWNLLRRTATAFLFFQPFVWKLSRRMEAAAEEVCDDYVVQFGGNRQEYAHRLVDIAELSLPPLAAAGVGIVAIRSMLAGRVARIMDTSRSLSTRVGGLLLALMLLAGLSATLLVGFVGIEPNRAAAEATKATEDEDADTLVYTDKGAVVPDATKTDAAKDDEITVRGLVVDPNGLPMAEADVIVLRWFWNADRPEPLAKVKTDRAGRFEISYRKSQFFETAGRPDQWREAQFTAFADGFGPGWVAYEDIDGGEEPTIRLTVDDVPIEGRIVDLEGKPVAGATIEVAYLNAPKNGDLTKWLDAVRARQSIATAFASLGDSVPLDSANRWKDIATDADGRFRLTGIGRERHVRIHVKHPTIVTQTLSVVTRVMEPIAQPAYNSPDTHEEINYGARFEYIAAPSRPIEGIVRDAETGEPIAGAEIWSHQFAGENIGGVSTIKTKSDGEGRYRLKGMPKGEGNEILVVPTDLPYFTAWFEVPDPLGIEPAKLDLELHRGVWVSGRVTDQETGEGVSARIYYIAPPDNPLAAELPEIQNRSHIIYFQDRYRTASDGSYRVVALPGRGIVGVGVMQGAYPTGQGYDAIEGIEDRDGYRNFNSALAPTKKYPTAVKEVRIPESSDGVVCDFVLDPGRHVAMRVVDSAGKPLPKVMVDGTRGVHDNPLEMSEAEFEIVALRDDETRTVLLHHEARRLGKALRVTPNDGEGDPIIVRLEPCATVIGRLIDSDGKPVGGLNLRIDVDGDGDYGKHLRGASTDADGRFRHEAFLPGLTYNILAEGTKIEFAEVARKLEVQPGETIDLGTIDITSEKRPEIVRVQANEAESSETTDAALQTNTPAVGVEAPSKTENDTDATPDESTQHVTGRVLGPDGKPVVGATVVADWVFVGGDWPRPRTAPSQQLEHEIVARTKSDDKGNFELEFSKDSPREGRLSHGWHIAAFAPGYGPAWMRDVRLLEDKEPVLRLARDTVVRGRIVDLEGKPVAGARVSVRELRPAKSEQAILDWIAEAKKKSPPSSLGEYFSASFTPNDGKYPPAFPSRGDDGGLAQGSPALPDDATTDQDGRFEFKDLGENRLAMLEIEGPSVAKSYVHVVSRDMDTLSARPLNFVGVRSDRHYGREFELVAEPTQPVEGTVTDADSGKPLANVRIRLGQFADNIYSQTDFLSTRTDDEGRYRLIGAPQGGGHRIDVESGVDQPYFETEKKLESARDSFEPLRCDFELKRGKWIVGTVTDDESGAPVVDATVEYLPLRSNEYAKDYPNYRPEITGSVPLDRFRTDKDGRFRVLAIPGAGILAAIVQNNNEDRYLYTRLNVEELPKHLVGEHGNINAYHPWTVTGYNALREVEILESGDEFPYNLKLKRGLARRLKLIDASGQPVTGVHILGRVFPSHLEEPLKDSVVELIGLGANDERVVALLNPERRIGKAMLISAGDEITVQLEAYAVARGRVVDEDGQPMSDVAVGVSIDHTDNWGRNLIGATSDAEGRFEVLLPPGLTYRVAHYSTGGPNFSAQCQAVAGGLFELGDVADGIELGTEQTAKMIAAREPQETSSATSAALSKADGGASKPKEIIKINGQVVDQDDKPIAGASVRLPDDVSDEWQTASSDTNGRFEIKFNKAQFTKPDWHQEPWRHARLVAEAEGFAPAWISGDELAANASPILKLKRDDVPIRGQILTIEGEPVARATLEVWDIYEPNSGKLEGLLKTVRDDPDRLQGYMNREMRYFPGNLLKLQMKRGTLGRAEGGNPQITTDDEGRFECRGIGPERLVRIWLKGPNVESTQLRLVTRNELDAPKTRARLTAAQRMMLDTGAALPQLYADSFTHHAGPSVPITGVVRDKATGKPLAGIGVSGWLRNTDNHASAVTDENGRYELTGLATEGTFQQLDAGPSEEAREKLPYLGAEKEKLSYSATSPLTTADTDFELTRGILVRGRVTDAATQQPVKARVEYMAPADNPSVQALTDELWPYADAMTDDDGEFTIAVLPGPGALAVGTRLSSDLPDRYRPADPRDFGLPLSERGFINTANRGIVMPWHYKAAKFVDLKPGETPSALGLSVRPVTDVARIRCVDEEGRPIRDVSVIGHLPWSGDQPMLPHGGIDAGDTNKPYIEVAELDAEDRQPVVFLHRDRKAAGILNPSRSERKPRLADLKQDDDGAYLLTLGTSASITGRLVDAEGNAADGSTVELHLVTASNPTGSNIEIIQRNVDQKGKFVLPDLPAGGPYWLAAGGPSFRGGIVKRDIVLAAGEKIDLGAIDITKAEQPERKKPAKPMEQQAAAQAEIRGKVVGPDRKPVAGAKLHWITWSMRGEQPAPQLLATTDENGEFRFASPDTKPPATETVSRMKSHQIVVVAPGYGMAYLSPHQLQSQKNVVGAIAQALLTGTSGPTIELPADAAVRGRIMNIDGQPVAKARISIRRISEGKLFLGDRSSRRDLAARGAEKEDIDWRLRLNDLTHRFFPAQLSAVAPSARTGADGSFELHGVGADRLVELLIEGDGVESALALARTIPGDTVTVAPAPNFGPESQTLYGPEFTHLLGPSKPLEGRVLDLDTEKPLVGAVVRAFAVHGESLHSSRDRQHFVAITDADGHYRITGLPIGGDNKLVAFTRGDDAYVPIGHAVNTAVSGPTAKQDFRLKRGVWAEGRAHDASTNEPLAGELEYYLLRNAEVEQAIPGLRNAFIGEHYSTDADGKFRVPVLAARGILAFRYAPRDSMQTARYPRGIGAAKIAGGEDTGGMLMFPTLPSYLIPSNYQAVIEVAPQEGQDKVAVDIPLSAGGQITVRVVDEVGKPVAGLEFYGHSENFGWQRNEGPKCEVIGLEPGDTRKLFFFHRQRNLAGAATVDDQTKDGLTVQLSPAGTLRGRLIDDDGTPIADATLTTNYEKLSTDPDAAIWPAHPDLIANPTQIPVDRQGRFQLDGLIPGWKYSGWASAPRKVDGAMMDSGIGRVFDDVTLEAGKTLDLGDVVPGSFDAPRTKKEDAGPKTEAPKAGAKDAARNEYQPKDSISTPEGRTLVYGRVLGADSKPVVGAHVAAIGTSSRIGRGGDLDSRDEVLAETTTDSDGRYELKFAGISSKTHHSASLVVRADGAGFAWQQLDPDANAIEKSFQLKPEEPIRGRLVDIEGRPTAGIRMTVRSVMVAAKDEWMVESAGYRVFDDVPAAWPQPVTSDEHGHFAIHNIRTGNGVTIFIDGDDRFARQELVLNTGIPEQRGERDGTYRPAVVKNLKPGEEAVLALAPAQIFEGDVTYEDTGKPAPHARLTIWASQQEFGSMHSVAGKADADGHYKISPYPGIRFGITAYPPDGAPYLTRELPEIDWEDSAATKQVDVTLPRGILVRGKVVESSTDAPVANASIQYVTEDRNDPQTTEGVLTGWQGIQLSDEVGEFEITVLPGPGRLVVHGPKGEYVVRELSSRELSTGRPGGWRYYANAVEKLDPEPEGAEIEVTIKLERAGKVAGRLVDEQGEPVDKVLVISRLNIHPTSLEWVGWSSEEALGGRFEISGFAPDRVYEIYFLQPQKRLGATAKLRADGSAPTITLHPCGEAVARVKNTAGQPLVDHSPILEMVVTPGAHESDRLSMRLGMLRADSDFISNIDRTNYQPWPKSDSEGIISYPALIPGATYRLMGHQNGGPTLSKEFAVEPRQIVDLGTVVIDAEQ